MDIKEDYYKNGQKKYEYWYLDGKLDRKDGPAVQCWYENGQKWYEYWYLNGKQLSEREFLLLNRKRKLGKL
ncbi:MAG: hypothetical protein GF317_24510 [Candidatus Lokiarchaeota archaeon]|nr:hypothetical protein [Candidatus Lokiarchaeota archaeon]